MPQIFDFTKPSNQPKDSDNRTGICMDTLIAAIEHGPLWDGDVPSKAGRDNLIERNFLVRIISDGKDGYTAATYLARDFYCQYFNGATIAEAMENRKKNFS